MEMIGRSETDLNTTDQKTDLPKILQTNSEEQKRRVLPPQQPIRHSPVKQNQYQQYYNEATAS